MTDFQAILGSTPAWLSSAQDSLKAGNASAALRAAEQAQRDCAKSGDKKGEGAALVMAAQAAIQDGSWDVSVKSASEALGIFQKLKDKAGESAALLLIATASFISGQFEDALSGAEDAASLALKAGSTKQLAYSKARVAEAALALLLQARDSRDNPDERLQRKALEAAQEAAKGLKDIAEKREYAKVVSDLAAAYLMSGNSNMAIAKAKAAQRLHQADLNVSGEATVLLTLAKALKKEGTPEPAKQTLEDASNLFASVGDHEGQAAAYGLLQRFQSQDQQEKKDFTKRILARFDKKDAFNENDVSNHRVTPSTSARFFSPPMQQQTFGPPTTRFIGFMARAAAPPPAKSGGGGVQNRKLLYNVSWN